MYTTIAKGLIRRLTGALPAIALALTVVAAPARAEPAIWVITDHDSTIYLFGTVHILPPHVSWRTPKIDAALEEADELWMEIADLTSFGAQLTSGILTLRFGLSLSRPLSSRLTSEEFADLDRAARSAGMTARQLNIFRPWLAALTLQAMSTVSGGFDAGYGVEMMLDKDFKAKQRPIRGFETLEDQIRIFSDLPEEDELDFLRETIASMDAGSSLLNDMVETWAAGDMAAFERIVIPELSAGSDAAYDALITRRNANWTERIEDMLAGSGTIFIAVGAGHLVGPDSVQEMLKTRSIEARRH